MTRTTPNEHIPFPRRGAQTPVSESQLPSATRSLTLVSFTARQRHSGPLTSAGTTDFRANSFPVSGDSQASSKKADQGYVSHLLKAYRSQFRREPRLAPSRLERPGAENENKTFDPQEIWFRERDSITYVVAKPASPKLRVWIASFVSLAFALGSLLYALEVLVRS